MGERRVRVIEGGDWYEHPKWYDTLHWPGTVAEVRGLERVARDWCGGEASWDGERCLRMFEPGCGTARHLRVAAERGHRVVGLDVSRAMLAYGRGRLSGRGLGGRLVEGDMADFGCREVLGEGEGGFDLAFCLANSVRHLGVGEAAGSDAAVAGHLRCVGGVLKGGGVYAVDVGLTVYGLEEETEDVWEGSRGPLRVTQVVQYLPASAGERREGVVSQLAVVTPSEEAHFGHRYELRSFDGGEWSRAVEAGGMEVLGVVDEDGEVLFGPGDDGWRRGWMGAGVFLLGRRCAG